MECQTLSTASAARLLGWTPQRLHRAAKAGEAPAPIGRDTWPKAQIEAFAGGEWQPRADVDHRDLWREALG